MIKTIFLILILYGSLLFSWEHFGSIKTVDGFAYEGVLISRTGQIEWRQDIYETVNADGEKETFILEPATTGKISLANIKDISRLTPNTGPSKYVDVSNNIRAKLLLKYAITTKDNRKFYISDFITLNDYVIEIPQNRNNKQIYITKIDNLKFYTSPLPSSQKTIQPQGKKDVAQNTFSQPNAVTFRTQVIINPDTDKTNIFLIIVIALLSITIIFLLLYFSHREKRKPLHVAQRGKHVKKRHSRPSHK